VGAGNIVLRKDAREACKTKAISIYIPGPAFYLDDRSACKVAAGSFSSSTVILRKQIIRALQRLSSTVGLGCKRQTPRVGKRIYICSWRASGAFAAVA